MLYLINTWQARAVKITVLLTIMQYNKLGPLFYPFTLHLILYMFIFMCSDVNPYDMMDCVFLIPPFFILTLYKSYGMPNSCFSWRPADQSGL